MIGGVIGGVILQAVDGVICGCDGRVVSGFVGRNFDWLVIDSSSFDGEECPLVLGIERAIEASVEHVAVDVPFTAMVISVSLRF